MKKNKINYRLPTHLKPFYYEISIKSFIGSMYAEKSFKFDGNINISFTCLNSTDKIVLHIKDLEIKNETLKLTHSNEIIEANLSWTNDFDREFMIINLNKECVKFNNYTLHMLYTGEISENLAGYYQSSYASLNDQTN